MLRWPWEGRTSPALLVSGGLGLYNLNKPVWLPGLKKDVVKLPIQFDAIIQSIIAGNASAVREHVKEAVAAGIDPVDIVTGGLVAAMDLIGTRFERNEIYVTDLLVTARAMHAGLKELRPYMAASNTPPAGRAVIGTVTGDLHDIGKNLLGLLLETSGFEVMDLGVDVPPGSFVEAVVKHKPHVLCLSALLTTTVNGMGETIFALREAGIRDQVKVVVGGAPLNGALARKLGADAYAPDAVTAVQVIKDLISSPANPPSPVILEKVFSGNALEELQAAFSSLVGLHLVVVDPWGRPLSPPGRFTECSGYCQRVRAVTGGVHTANDGYGTVPLWDGLKDAFAYRCHAGLIEISYPLVGDTGKVGAIICGHFLLEDNKLTDTGFPKEVPVLSRERLDMVCRLLSFVGGRIMELSQALVSNRQLEEQRASFIHFMKRQHQLEEALRDAELKALQSQVNPHFLFNSLNTVARLALLEGAGRTERVVAALARLMRYSLYQVKTMVSVREEVRAVQDYLLIQETRFQGRITSRVEVAQEVMAARMPCMILQPLVENAYLHGLEPRKEGGLLEVRGELKAGQVCFEIIDNGVGIPEEIKKDIFTMPVKSGGSGQISGLGIPNVYRRLQYHFGSRCALDIESYPGKGTGVYLAFPFQDGEGG